MPLSDAQRRAVRTLLQSLTGAGIVAFVEVFVLPYVPGHPELSAAQRTMAVVIAGGALSFILNWTEDHTSLPAVLKAPPSPGVNPEPKPTP